MIGDKAYHVSLNFDSSPTASLDVSCCATVAPARDARNPPSAGNARFIVPLSLGTSSAIDPFVIAGRLARLEALLQRPSEVRETTLRVGTLEVDLIERTAKRDSRRIDLRPREFRLLKYMMQHSNLLLKRDTLLQEVWDYKFIPDTNLVDVHMGRLRRKVDGPNETPMIHSASGGFILRAGC